MSEIFRFFIFFALGLAFSLVFWMLRKVKFSSLSRFVTDLSLSVSLCLAYYALNFVTSNGVLAPFSLVGTFLGWLTPRLFLPIS